MKSKTCLPLLVSLFTLYLAVPAHAANLINVNIGAEGGNTKVDGEEAFGVAALGTVSTGWNNIGWSFANLLWNDGSESTVGVEVSFPNNRDFFGSGYVNTPLNYGAPHYAGTSDDPGTGLAFYNLKENFPDGYYVILYITGFLSNTGGLVTDGRTTYYYKPAQDNKTAITPETLIEATTRTDPGEGNYPEAHYAVYGSKELPLTADIFTFRMDVISGGAVAIGGAQIVSASAVTIRTDWAGYPLDELGFVDTGRGFLGWLWFDAVAEGNWLYSVSAKNWLFLDETLVTPGMGTWCYTLDASWLKPVDITGNWFYSLALETWCFHLGETVGSGPGWVFIYDLSM